MKRLLLLAAAGCALQGERARDGCPSGEVCSPDTPNGLAFLGAALGDEPLGRLEPRTIAAGGTQVIRVLEGTAASSPPFESDFDALSSAALLGIDEVAPPDVTVHGLTAGEALLRIVDPSSGLLYDRVGLSVRPVARVTLRPLIPASADRGFAENATFPWVALGGSTIDLIVRLESSSGERLVDETLTVETGGLSVFDRPSWDVLRVGVAGGGRLAVKTGDGVSRPFDIPIIARIDDILSVPADAAASSTTDPQPPGAATFCFRAWTGGTLIAGASWRFAAPGFTVTPAAAPSCTTLTGTAGQTGNLSVTAAAPTAASTAVTRVFAVTFRDR